ncbi:hypothetical protein BDQ17DRAFT_1375616, partial [Cyathus striatus]
MSNENSGDNTTSTGALSAPPCASDGHSTRIADGINYESQDATSSKHDLAATATSSNSEGAPSDWEVVSSSDKSSPIIPLELLSLSSNETEPPTLSNPAEDDTATSTVGGATHTSTATQTEASAEVLKPSAEDVIPEPIAVEE